MAKIDVTPKIDPTEPLTNAERQRRFRERQKAAGKHELRGIWVTDKEEKVLRKYLEQLRGGDMV